MLSWHFKTAVLASQRLQRQVSGYLEYGTDHEHPTVGEVQVLDRVASGLLRVSISVLCFFVT